MPGLRATRGVLICAVLAGLFFALVTQAHAALYLGAGAKIARANLDGSAFEVDFVQADSGPCAIAVDSSHLYWADAYSNSIGRAKLDGTAVERNFIKLADGTLPCGIALDTAFVYWPSMGVDTIGRARLDGSEVVQSFIPTARRPCAVAVSEAAIYWASETEDKIWRTDIAGVNAPEVVLDKDTGDPCGLALQNGHLFWVESLEGTIGRANLDGSEPLPQFITGGHYPVSLAIQGENLYWVNNEWGFESIGRASIDGTNVNQAFLRGFEHPYALAADATQVVPRPPIPVPEALASSPPKLGKLRRLRGGSVVFPIDLPGSGRLEADVPGMRVEVQSTSTESGPIALDAGRKWLSVSLATKPRPGSRCILRAYKRGAKIKLVLRLGFTETGRTSTATRRPFLLFRPLKDSKAVRPKGPAVTCINY